MHNLNVVSWNVMGQLGSLKECKGIERFLHKCDVLGIVHSGIVNPGEDVSPSSAHVCIYQQNRPVDPKYGGLACFVKRQLAKHTKVVLSHPEFGYTWISVTCPKAHQRRVMICFVYLPPQQSSYYKMAQLDPEEVWGCLQRDIAKFQCKGPVLLMGDFNARCGQLSEADFIEPHVRRHLPLMDGLVNRHSKDRVLNRTGRRLLNVCATEQLVILNGRADSDRGGSCTYRHLSKGVVKLSVVDYAILSSKPFWAGVDTRPDVRVIPFQEAPGREQGGRFDHNPLWARIPWSCIAGSTNHEEGSSPGTASPLKWRHRMRVPYSAVVRTNAQVQGMLKQVGDQDISVPQSVEMLMKAITTAASEAQLVGRPVRAGSRPVQYRKSRPWFSKEAGQLCKVLKRLRKSNPANSSVVKEAKAKYRKQVRRDKNAATGRRIAALRRQLAHEPGTFWKTVGKQGSTPDTHSLNEWTTTFRQVFSFSDHEWQSQEELEAHCAQYPELFGPPPAAAKDAAFHLNQPFTTEEIVEALKAMRLGKAAGADGIQMEFFRQAYEEIKYTTEDGKTRTLRHYLLAAPLCELFNKILETGQYPEGWGVGVVVPVPKAKGDPHNMDDYRGITIGPALGKLFAQALLHRLDRWAETNGLRAPTQFGFRKGKGTRDAVFLLSHLIDKAGAGKKAMCVAFVDFKKAYDSVSRELLWKVLEHLGLHGKVLTIIKNMYSDVRLRVGTRAGLGEEFTSVVGVKQGDPLSPLLFGLFVDRLVDWIKARAPEGDITCVSAILQAILYADDLALVAHSPRLLQMYLDALQGFCKAMKMTVNAGKTEIVVFHRKHLVGEHRWTFAGRPLVRSSQFVYLGIPLHEAGMAKSKQLAIQWRVDKARGALFAQMGICEGLRIRDPYLLTRLFDAVVLPTLMYGCEVWGPGMTVNCKPGLFSGKLEEVQKLFIRMQLGVSKSTSHTVMLRETWREPVLLRCLVQCGRFWNSIAARSPEDLTHLAMIESCLHVPGGGGQLYTEMLNRVTEGEALARVSGDRLHSIHLKGLIDRGVDISTQPDTDLYMRNLEAAQSVGLGGSLVRRCPDSVRDGFKRFKYWQWMLAGGGQGEGEEFPPTFCLHNQHEIRTLAQFRCGVHWLACERQRRVGRSNVARSQRFCVCCPKKEVEDELHVLMCPAYSHLKPTFPAVFWSDEYATLAFAYEQGLDTVDDCMRVFMSVRRDGFQMHLARFLIASRQVREQLLSGLGDAVGCE